MSEALRLEGVRKSFGKLDVLRGIDLTVEEHQVVCLIGASGSGKSTLLRCVNLLEQLDAGRVVLRGEDISARGVDVNRIRRKIGDRLPGLQPLPAHVRATERHARPDQGAEIAARAGRRAGG